MEFIKPVAGVITCNYDCHKSRDTGDPGNRIYGTDIAGLRSISGPAMSVP